MARKFDRKQLAAMDNRTACYCMGAIIHAVGCRVLRKTYRGGVVPVIVLASVITALLLAAKMDMSITAVPFLALTFAVAGFVLAPSEKTTPRRKRYLKEIRTVELLRVSVESTKGRHLPLKMAKP